MFGPVPVAFIVVVVVIVPLVGIRGNRACFDGVFVRRWETDGCFEQAVAGPAGLHFAPELVGREEVRVVVFGVGIAAGLRPGEVGIRGGCGGRGAVVEVAGDDEMGCRRVQTRHWRYRVLAAGRGREERFGVVGAFVREPLGGVLSNGGGRDGREDEAADDVLPVVVAALQFVFHGGQVRRHECEFERRVAANRISHPYPHGALVPHFTHPHAHPCRLQPPYLGRLVSKHKDHYGRHADVPGDDVDVARVVEGGCGDGDGMAEVGEVGDEVGAAEEGVGDWGELLEAEDEDVGWGGVGECGEEVSGEGGGVDRLAATIESYDVGV